MLTELTYVANLEGEPPRKWYSDDYFDLIVWTGEDHSIIAFQLCYDRGDQERAIMWRNSGGYSHMIVDSGENRPGKYKAAPMLLPDGKLDVTAIAERFRQASAQLKSELASFVYDKLRNYHD